MIKYKVDKFFVRVEPAEFTDMLLGRPQTKEEEARTACNRLIRDIKRHIDDVDTVSLEYDGHYECSFCGCTVVNKDDYECCDESIKERESEKKAENL